jgi:hypothetical protein
MISFVNFTDAETEAQMLKILPKDTGASKLENQ